jgi:N-methylhydantoinase B
MYTVPVEVNESKSALIIEKYEMRTDSGGAGKFRGGLGTETVGYLLLDGVVQNKMVRSRCLPWGLHGGGDALGSEAYVIKPDGTQDRVPRTDRYPFPAGYRVRMLTGGGGGYGPAFERDPERVRLDVVNELVSLESARRDYGVALDPKTFALDADATRELRARWLAGNEGKSK